MIKYVFIVGMVLFFSNSVRAEGESNRRNTVVLGIRAGAGMGWAATNEGGAIAASDGDPNEKVLPPSELESTAYSKPVFAGAGAAYADIYVSRKLALSFELGALTRGYKKDLSDEVGATEFQINRFLYLSPGIGVKLKIRRWQFQFAMAAAIGIAAWYRYEYDFGENRNGRVPDVWEYIRRFNFGPRASIGYAIPVGAINLVPSLDWSMHLLKEHTFDSNNPTRFMNVMFHMAVEFSL